MYPSLSIHIYIYIYIYMHINYIYIYIWSSETPLLQASPQQEMSFAETGIGMPSHRGTRTHQQQWLQVSSDALLTVFFPLRC